MARSAQVQVTSQFEKAFSRLPRNIQQLAERKHTVFQNNVFQRSLATHKLKGELDGFWSYSINYSYRVMFRFIDPETVLYYDIGTHEIYK